MRSLRFRGEGKPSFASSIAGRAFVKGLGQSKPPWRAIVNILCRSSASLDKKLGVVLLLFFVVVVVVI